MNPVDSVVSRSAPVTTRFWRCRRRAAKTCVSNACLSCNGTFIVQRYGLMPPAAGGHRECCLGKASSGCGGSGSGRSALKAVAVGFPNVTRFERFSFQCSRRQEHRRSHAGAVAASAGVQHSAAKSREHLAGNGGPASLSAATAIFRLPPARARADNLTPATGRPTRPSSRSSAFR